MKTSPWHSVKGGVYHDDTACELGNNIEPENRKDGKGGKSKCARCTEIQAQT